jgi:hypothetical protein
VSVLLPERAKGRLLAVTVRISLNGQTTTKIVCFPISS